MSIYEVIGSGGIKLRGESEFYCDIPTCKQIYDDIQYFLIESKMPGKDEETVKRYARVAILFTAFYVESLANSLLDEIIKRGCPDKLKGKNYIRREKTINKYQDIYSFLNNKKLNQEQINGINDLFRIRNEIIAHPKAREIIAGTGVPKGKGWTGTREKIEYKCKEFKDFPNIWEYFTRKEAIIIYNEIKRFLKTYYDFVRENFPNWMSTYFLLEEVE
jgi:hypothetical protein